MSDTDTDELSSWVVEYLTNPSLADPYPMLSQLRERDPVHHSRLGHWLFSRYRDVDYLQRGGVWSRFEGAKSEVAESWSAEGELAEALHTWLMMLINRDEPDHRRIRRLLQSAFTPRAVEGWRPTVEKVVETVFDGVEDYEEFDFLRSVGYPIPEIIICELMGVPHEDHALWGEWAAKSVARNRAGGGDAANLRNAEESILNFYYYFQTLVRERRKNLGDDLISVLIRAEEEGDQLDEDELIGTAIMLITAGHETTANMSGNGLYLLFRYPDEFRKLLADRSLVPSAVEEMLRFEPTTKLGLPRVALEDVEYEGKFIPAGSRAMPVRPSANRDPAVFTNPETFDICRANNRHMSFGTGVHYCLGALLARLELTITFVALCQRFPDIELAETPTWRASGVRSLNGLRVQRTRRAA